MSSKMTAMCSKKGLKIVDAKAPAILCVNKKDVATATPKEPGDCAFSRAIRRNFKTIKSAYFFRTAAYLEYDDRVVRYLMPPSMQKEVVAFDRGGHVEPGNYRLTPPCASGTLKKSAERSARTRARNGRGARGTTEKKIVLRHKTTNVRGLKFKPGGRK